eukprot:608965-Amphidinium_carterae.1
MRRSKMKTRWRSVQLNIGSPRGPKRGFQIIQTGKESTVKQVEQQQGLQSRGVMRSYVELHGLVRKMQGNMQ